MIPTPQKMLDILEIDRNSARKLLGSTESRRLAAYILALIADDDAIWNSICGLVIKYSIAPLMLSSERKVKAGLEYAASGAHQNYAPGILELGVALDAIDMLVADVCNESDGSGAPTGVRIIAIVKE